MSKKSKNKKGKKKQEAGKSIAARPREHTAPTVVRGEQSPTSTNTPSLPLQAFRRLQHIAHSLDHLFDPRNDPKPALPASVSISSSGRHLIEQKSEQHAVPLANDAPPRLSESPPHIVSGVVDSGEHTGTAPTHHSTEPEPRPGVHNPVSDNERTEATDVEEAKVAEKPRRRSAPLVAAGSGYQSRAIPTMFNGRQYRSRLEARWAAFMSLCKWDCEYEPDDLAGWIPDFAIWGATGNTIWVEVKPVVAFPRSVASKMEQGLPDAYRARGDELLIVGTKPSPTPRLALQEDEHPRLGWLAQTPLRAADGRWHWGDSTFGRWASDARFGFCHSESHHDRITGIHAEICGGRPGAKTSELSHLWAEATNLVQWRSPRER